jgi:hypothetical protein
VSWAGTREVGELAQRRRTIPLLGVIEVGVVDLHVLIDKFVAERDPQRFEPSPSVVVRTDAIGADDEEDVRDRRRTVGTSRAMDSGQLTDDREEDRAGSSAEQCGEV